MGKKANGLLPRPAPTVTWDLAKFTKKHEIYKRNRENGLETYNEQEAMENFVFPLNLMDQSEMYVLF